MNNQSAKAREQKLTSVFNVSPRKAYEKLISSNLCFKTEFWIEFKKLELPNLIKKFPEEAYFIYKANGLRVFQDLREFYENAITEQKNKLVEINPSSTNLIKSLFLALDLGDASSPIVDVKYSPEALTAVKTIFKEFSRNAKSDNQSAYSVELFNTTTQLLRLQTDRVLLDNLFDIYQTDNFLLFPTEHGIGYELRLIDDNLKKNDIYILGELKSAIKRNFKKIDSQPKISEELHFQEVDGELKTDEGLAVIRYSSNSIVTVTGEGFTALPMDDSIFELMKSDDPKLQAEGQRKAIEQTMLQNFHHKHRHALAEVYQPNDEINIKQLKIEIENGKSLTLYELLAAISSLIAFADNIRYLSEGEVNRVRSSFLRASKELNPNYTDEQLVRTGDSNIAIHLPLIEARKEYHLFFFFPKELLMSNFIQIEELKTKSPEELNSIVDFLCALDNPLPYNFIYKTDGGYFFSYQTCNRFSVLKDVYDYYISDKLFNSTGKDQSQRLTIGENHAERTAKFNDSLIDLFHRITPYAKSIKYKSPSAKYNFGKMEGDMDVLVYFEEEKLLLSIQVKLKNVSVQSERGKINWVKTSVEKKGTEQVRKDAELLGNPEGLKFIAEEFGLSKSIDPKTLTIYPLIVTDNFFADHIEFTFNKDGDSVFCISYFELKYLLLNQKVHPSQADWPNLAESKSATMLISLIEENVFWNFLQEFIPNYKSRKTLTVINEENRVRLNI